MKKRWKITVEYDGWKYHGWQRQDNVPTVQASVEHAIFAFCQQEISIQCAGRTDAGVHSFGQVAHFDLDYGDRPLTGNDLMKAINAHLRPQPICVKAAEEVNDDFHARFSARNKYYRYRIVSRSAPAVLDFGKVWHTHHALDIEAMQEAAKPLLGTHDFTSFRDSECQSKSPVKTLDRFDIDICDYDGMGTKEIRCHVEGQSFLHHQVRNMVGTLAMVGQGKWEKEQVVKALEARDRTKAGPTAPADGLYLMRIDY